MRHELLQETKVHRIGAQRPPVDVVAAVEHRHIEPPAPAVKHELRVAGLVLCGAGEVCGVPHLDHRLPAARVSAQGLNHVNQLVLPEVTTPTVTVRSVEVLAIVTILTDPTVEQLQKGDIPPPREHPDAFKDVKYHISIPPLMKQYPLLRILVRDDDGLRKRQHRPVTAHFRNQVLCLHPPKHIAKGLVHVTCCYFHFQNSVSGL